MRRARRSATRSNWEANAYEGFEGAAVRWDVVLADLVDLLHPKILPDHELVYLGRLETPPNRSEP